jgi:hypothetical protein
MTRFRCIDDIGNLKAKMHRLHRQWKNIIIPAIPAILRPHPCRVWWWVWLTGWIHWQACSVDGAFRMGRPFGLACATVWCKTRSQKYFNDLRQSRMMRQFFFLPLNQRNASLQRIHYRALRICFLKKDTRCGQSSAAEQAHNPAAALTAIRELGMTARKDWNEILPSFARCVHHLHLKDFL